MGAAHLPQGAGAQSEGTALASPALSFFQRQILVLCLLLPGSLTEAPWADALIGPHCTPGA